MDCFGSELLKNIENKDNTLLPLFNAMFRVQVALQRCKWNRDVWYFLYIIAPVFGARITRSLKLA